MTRKDDLEQWIREVYELVRGYEKIIRLSGDPLERERAKGRGEDAWDLINSYRDFSDGLLTQHNGLFRT